jgi:phosphate-selective porin OprO/OprP
MKNFKRSALASVINLALSGIPDAQADANSDALERRIRELESRLEKLDKSGALPNKPVATTPEVEKLSKKVNTLERKLEVQDEVAATTAKAAAAATKNAPVVEAGLDGFKIYSADKEHLLRVGGTLQADGRFFINNNQEIGQNPAGPSAFLIRQGRLLMEGYAYKDINFKILADFANSNLLPDAYLDYTYHPSAELLVGKFKPSVSLERLQGDAQTAFLERALPSNLAPNRDVGAQLHGGFNRPGYQAQKVAGVFDMENDFSYQIGVSDGSGDSGNNTTQGTANGGAIGATSNALPGNSVGDNKEVVGRFFAQPFKHTDYRHLKGLGLGFAGTFGDPSHQFLNVQRTALGQSQFLDYTAVRVGSNYAPGLVTSNGQTQRLYPQAYWNDGPFSLMGEYVASTQHLNGLTFAPTARNNNITQTNKAFQIQATAVLTGEDATFNGIKPAHNFDLSKGTWGAWQLAARFSGLKVDSDTFRILDPTKSASQVTSWTAGINWFLNKNAIIRLDYEKSNFNGGAGTSTLKAGNNANNTVYHVTDRPTESVFATRFQFTF